jgi:Flp pilus assembly protein protease CpaA
MILLIEQVILVFATALGAMTDAKTGYIYDWITYPMVAAGIILSIVLQQWNNLILGAILFVGLFIMYKFGKIGGGDVKLFVGIALLNPTNDYFFIVSIMFFAAMSAMMFYSIFYFIKYVKIGINIEENKKGIKKAILFGIIIIAYFSFLVIKELITPLSAEIMVVPILFGLIMVALQEGIKKNFFETKIQINQIEEDEVLAEGRNTAAVVKLLKGKSLIGEEEKKILQKNLVKSVYVLRGLPPFGPFILAGVIGAILMPDFLFFIFM